MGWLLLWFLGCLAVVGFVSFWSGYQYRLDEEKSKSAASHNNKGK